MDVVRAAIGKLPSDQKILFDGIPRNFEQKEQFEKVLKETDRKFFCLQITLPEEEAWERLLLRATKEGRTDDIHEESIHRRIEVFKDQTVPVIKAYRSEGKMVDVDGLG